MKWIIVGLLVLNAGLLAFFELYQANQALSPSRPPPLHPEQIRLLTPQQVEAMPRKSPPVAVAQPEPVTAVTTACYEWGNFSARNLPRARSVLNQFSLAATEQQQTPQSSTRYWVYIPRRASAQAANAKMEELKALGLDDIFVVQEPQWRYAISLGLFKDEQLATRRLEDVKRRGVSSAIKAVRNQEQGQSSFIINNMSADTAAEIEKLRPDFPGSEIKQVTCQ